jgi:protein ImuB
MRGACVRIACVRIADFAVWARRRHDPTLAAAAVVVGGVPPERGSVQALSAEARCAGLRPGMTLSAAQAVLPAARFLRPDPTLEQRETDRLAALLRTLTPGVEVAARPAGGRVFFLDGRGLGRLHASEEAFAHRTHDLLAGHGYPARVGVAGNKFTAEVAARSATACRVVAAGEESAFLAPLPLAHLPLDPAVRDELESLGLATLGEWAALAADTVAARFGSDGLRALDLARGVDPSPLVATPPAAPLEVAVELDEPLDGLEPLTFHLKRAIDRMCGRLGAAGCATSRLRVTLDLDSHERSVREASFLRPTLAPRLLLDCLRLVLGRDPVGARITSFRVEAVDPAPARPEQLLLFARRHPDGDRQAVEAALARVQALLGPLSVVAPRPGPGHRPELQVTWEPYVFPPPEPAPRPEEAPPPPALTGLPARLLDPPVAAEVVTARGRPGQVVAATVRGRVLRAEGPHVIDGGWWGEPYDREYYIVTLGDGGRYWLYRDRIAGGWFLHGVFD